MFKNETHNHPTEIEPFGGAATCLGGAIRDPLSGRAYVYQAMRVTGAGDPTAPALRNPAGQAAAAQAVPRPPRQAIPPTATRSALPPALCTRSTIRAMLPSAWRSARSSARLRPKTSCRERPEPGDVVILLGGTHRPRRHAAAPPAPPRATPSSPLETCGAEVQKGNAARGAQAPAPVPRRRGHPADQALQRLRRGRRVAWPSASWPTAWTST